ncbi:MAG TPA: hypothetical protein VKA76_02015, partial [Gammaproteobacteria bacterium]|nr:hypothetical protein [Gammaproteobacteria bacterium]
STAVGVGVGLAAKHFVTPFHEGLVIGVPPMLTVAVLMMGIAYNQRIWQSLEDRWQRTFMCKRCGTVFQVSDFELPEGANPRSYRHRRGTYLPRGASVTGKR